MATSTSGSWKSPITADLVVADSVKLSQIQLDGADVYWIEMRPNEGGRNVIVRHTGDGRTEDCTPAGFNARSRAHEYGGGAYAVHQGQIFFSNDLDGRIYVHRLQTAPVPVTPNRKLRFADLSYDATRQRLLSVMEDHTVDGEHTNQIVSHTLKEKDVPVVFRSGNDFYSNPIVRPDGRQVAWLSWNHPDMPWDSTTLWVADLDAGGAALNAREVAGSANESIFQPQWAPDGRLYFVSDKNGWWNIHRFDGSEAICVHEKAAEFALPQWLFGMSTYGFASAQKLICCYCDRGLWRLASIDTDSGDMQPIELPFTYLEDLRANEHHAAFIGGSEISAPAIVKLDLETLEFDILKRSADPKLESTYFSRPEIIEFPTGNGLSAYGYFYEPQNRDFSLSPNERPPLLVKCHGGPTAATSATLDLRLQFWTSRGFAILDVNYGGSTGYGREYRQRLEGKWGIVDVEDCINGAKYLVGQGKVDRDRIAIAGGSAGGYTTLCALTFHDFFTVGASYYGICDMEALVKDTHKFESHYIDRLIGPYPVRRDLYLERSPIHFTEKLSCPIILMQGLEDRIVPPNQAEQMLNAVRSKGLPVAYLAFEGEQHGFRRAESIKRSIEAEFYFYSKIFGFSFPDDIEPIAIENLP